jgi:hypothetical protein
MLETLIAESQTWEMFEKNDLKMRNARKIAC